MAGTSARVEWVDYAKGICMLLIVMMHSTLGVEIAAGEESWMHPIVEFATPFRMPDFFLIAGLFLARAIDRDWRHYLDKKVVHYAYFYVLWLFINFAFKAPSMAAETSWAEVGETFLLSFVEPFGILWFIYLLPILFVVTKLTRGVPWWLVLAIGAALQIAPIQTGWTVIDEFASRFVYFYAGYIFAPRIFRFAELVAAHRWAAVGGLAAWAGLNAAFVYTDLASLPGISLALGFIGGAAVVAMGSLLTGSRVGEPIRYCGANSIVIYLAFFIPMATTREALISLGVISDVGTIAAITWLVASIGPLILYWIVRNTPARILFERPRWAYIHDRPPKLAPAE